MAGRITRQEFLKMMGLALILPIMGPTLRRLAEATSAISALYDDFQGLLYSLKGSQYSPNSKWLCPYTGYGEVKTVLISIGTDQRALQERPRTSIQPEETHASLVLSTQKWQNFEASIEMRTLRQLRTGSSPNAWECAWLMWRFIDHFHHYYFILKPNGVEIGKKDNDDQAEEQVFLYTADTPKLKLDGRETIKIQQTGNRIRVWRTSTLIADVVDGSMSTTLEQAGSIGLYTEDALVQFDNVYVRPIE